MVFARAQGALQGGGSGAFVALAVSLELAHVDEVVVVVSAMGKQTDLLVRLAEQITDSPTAREMDMLLSTGEQVSVSLFAMALQSMGHKAVSLTGGQIGIRTDSSHTKARIQSISTNHVSGLLEKNAIVIAAGFQGYDPDGNIVTYIWDYYQDGTIDAYGSNPLFNATYSFN